MSATTSRPATLIPWPSWNEPFARTPRGYLARRETLWKCLMIFVGFASLGVSFCLTPIFIPVLAFLIFCAAVVCVVKVLPIRSVLREAREKCEPWRDQWLAFEQASAEFLRQVREREFRMDDALERAPLIPPVVWSLSHYMSKPLSDFSFNPTVPDNIQRAFAKVNLSRVLCELGRLGAPMVAGRVNDFSLIVIYVLANNLQYWVRVSYSNQGAALSPEVMVGVQNWSGPFTDETGQRYPGDLAKLKRDDIKTLLTLLLLGIPGFGWLFAIFGAWTDGRKFFRTNLKTNLRNRLKAWAGDSADPLVLDSQKHSIPGAARWTTLTQSVEARVEAMKGHVLQAVLRAFARND
jgi:hypothetical protein